jgi:ATP-dependent Clp protease ATP-binding subunit ClpC
MRFDRFTEKAQEAAMRAYEILQRHKHTQVDTEHVFLALVEQSDGAVPQILEKLNVPAELVARKLESILENAPKAGGLPYGATPTAQVFITPRLKRVMDVANDEAKKLNDEYISTEHIFLGIASERNTPSATVLREAGVTKEQEEPQRLRRLQQKQPRPDVRGSAVRFALRPRSAGQKQGKTREKLA